MVTDILSDSGIGFHREEVMDSGRPTLHICVMLGTSSIPP